MKLSDLPSASDSVSTTEWLNEYIKINKLSKKDVHTLSVSVQLLISELFEEIELMSSRATAIAVPLVKEKLGTVSIDIESLKTEAERLVNPSDFSTQKIGDNFSRIAQLVRARENIERVKERLVIIGDYLLYWNKRPNLIYP